jgi:hypothetical protein
MTGVAMQICKQALSILLSIFLVFQFDGCKKEATVVKTGTSQAPETTYATPTPDQLYQLVAPIALFPDNLLAQVLAASTFPDQVTAAYQWLQQNSGLKGQQLVQAVDQQPWDASVKGLTQFSDVLQQMATNLSWTSSLGDAYFNIPQSVMNAVQVMRQRAQQAGNLKTTPQQTVQVQNEPPGQAPPAEASSGQPQVTVVQSPPQTIVIQPSQPDVVYVPTYNPTAVYGAPVPSPPGYSTADMVATSLLSFGVGIAVGAAMSGGCCGWGYNSWGCGWHNNTVVYNHNTYISNSNTFANRSNYYNRNNVNANNINRNNINANNINRNNLNRNNVNSNNLNRNNRANNFDNNARPNFNQNRNQSQFRNENANNLAQQRGGGQRAGTQPNFNQGRNQQQLRDQNAGNLAQQRGGSQPNFNQQNRAANTQAQNRAGLGGNQPSAGNLSQNQRQAERGYGQQASRNSGNSAFGNYGEGGNARTNSARGQQSLNSGSSDRGSGGGDRSAGGGGGRSAGGGGGGRSTGGGRGRR